MVPCSISTINTGGCILFLPLTLIAREQISTIDISCTCIRTTCTQGAEGPLTSLYPDRRSRYTPSLVPLRLESVSFRAAVSFRSLASLSLPRRSPFPRNSRSTVARTRSSTAGPTAPQTFTTIPPYNCLRYINILSTKNSKEEEHRRF